jgi:hypothetical protein
VAQGEAGRNFIQSIQGPGLGGLGASSHRTLLAVLGDDLTARHATDLADVASRWCAQFWAAYESSPFRPLIDRCRALSAKKAFDPNLNPLDDPQARTQAEDIEFNNLKNNLTVGFCIGRIRPAEPRGRCIRNHFRSGWAATYAERYSDQQPKVLGRAKLFRRGAISARLRYFNEWWALA